MSGSTKQNVTAFVYDRRGRLLSCGNNSYTRTHRLQAHYAERTDNPSRIYLHAELDALIKAKRRGVIHKLVVLRVSKEGKPMNSKPCACCQLAIRDFGVKVVEHS